MYVASMGILAASGFITPIERICDPGLCLQHWTLVSDKNAPCFKGKRSDISNITENFCKFNA